MLQRTLMDLNLKDRSAHNMVPAYLLPEQAILGAPVDLAPELPPPKDFTSVQSDASKLESIDTRPMPAIPEHGGESQKSSLTLALPHFALLATARSPNQGIDSIDVHDIEQLIEWLKAQGCSGLRTPHTPAGTYPCESCVAIFGWFLDLAEASRGCLPQENFQMSRMWTGARSSQHRPRSGKASNGSQGLKLQDSLRSALVRYLPVL